MGLYHKRLLFQKDGQHYGVNLFTEKKGLSLTTSVDGQTLYAPISEWTPYSVPLKVHYQGQDLYVNNEPDKLPWLSFNLIRWTASSNPSIYGNYQLDNNSGHILCQIATLSSSDYLFRVESSLQNHPRNAGTTIEITYRYCDTDMYYAATGGLAIYIEENGQMCQRFSLNNKATTYTSSSITLDRNYGPNARIVYETDYHGSYDTHTELSEIKMNGQIVY